MTSRTSMPTLKLMKTRWQSSALADQCCNRGILLECRDFSIANNKKTRHWAGFFVSGLAVLDAEAFVALLELRNAAATVHQRLRRTGPGRMGGRVDVEVHRVALLAPGGAGEVLGAIGHHDFDGVVVWMDIGLH